MRLRYTRRALIDLQAILDYVAARSPQGATRVHARIQAVTKLLLERPLLGAQTANPRIRRLPTRPHRYLVFYEVAGDEVIIHAVRHAARNPSDMPGSA